MKKKVILVLLLVFSFALFLMCDSGESDDKAGDGDISETDIRLTSALIESVPQINTSTRGVVSGSIKDYQSLEKLFKLECYMDGTFDFCPAGIDPVTGGDNNPYKLTSFTLMGSIAHAEMYSGGLKAACSGTGGEVSAANFKAAQSGGDPVKFILDYYDLLSCISEKDQESTMYHTYSVDPEGTYQATLTTRYRVPYNDDADPGQNDIFQVYTSLEDDKATFLAYNYAGADTMLQRTVLLVNVKEHKFAIKHIEPKTDGNHDNVVAIGVGGIDIESGEFNPGYFYTKFSLGNGSFDDGCVNNATGSFEADMSKCTADSVPAAWLSSDEVAVYLGMSADEKSRLASFLAIFNSDAFLTAADAPANTTSDVEQNLPEKIEP